jgi:hypothetical protein
VLLGVVWVKLRLYMRFCRLILGATVLTLLLPAPKAYGGTAIASSPPHVDTALHSTAAIVWEWEIYDQQMGPNTISRTQRMAIPAGVAPCCGAEACLKAILNHLRDIVDKGAVGGGADKPESAEGMPHATIV